MIMGYNFRTGSNIDIVFNNYTAMISCVYMAVMAYENIIANAYTKQTIVFHNYFTNELPNLILYFIHNPATTFTPLRSDKAVRLPGTFARLRWLTVVNQ
jgi:hypothetical protein